VPIKGLWCSSCCPLRRQHVLAAAKLFQMQRCDYAIRQCGRIRTAELCSCRPFRVDQIAATTSTMLSDPQLSIGISRPHYYGSYGIQYNILLNPLWRKGDYRAASNNMKLVYQSPHCCALRFSCAAKGFKFEQWNWTMKHCELCSRSICPLHIVIYTL